MSRLSLRNHRSRFRGLGNHPSHMKRLCLGNNRLMARDEGKRISWRIHSKLRSITHVATKVHVILRSFVMLTWIRDTIELVKLVTLWKLNSFWPFTYVGVVHSPWPSWAMWHMHAQTFNKWQKKKKKTLHILTHGAIRWCGLTSLVVCINDNICDRRERNVTIKSEIWTTNFRSLGFWGIGERVRLWGLILRSFGCTSNEWRKMERSQHVTRWTWTHSDSDQ